MSHATTTAGGWLPPANRWMLGADLAFGGNVQEVRIAYLTINLRDRYGQAALSIRSPTII